jgi:hypothetical protein
LRLTLVIALMVAIASVGDAQPAATIQTRDTPDFRVETWGHVATEFSARLEQYSSLRSELEKGLPSLRVTDDPGEIRKAARALRKRIRAARAGAKQGDIFTPETRIEFRNALTVEVDANTWAAIMDDNPGERSNRINGAYPEGKALSTVPPNVLAVLPRLPEDVRYGFLGRHLILLDTRANVILDRIPLALHGRGFAQGAAGIQIAPSLLARPGTRNPHQPKVRNP